MTRSGILLIALGMLVISGCTKQPPPPPPASQVERELPQPKYVEHTIKYSGETLGVIAAWYTGKATNWEAIRDANPGINPKKMRTGQVVQIPDQLVTRREPLKKEFVSKFFGGSKKKGDQAQKDPSTAAVTQTESPSAPAEAPAAPVAPTAPESTPAVESAPTTTIRVPVAPVAPAAPSADDPEREKLLDELLN